MVILIIFRNNIMIYINPNLHWEEVFFNVSVGCNWPSGLKKENKNVAPGTTPMKDYNKKLIKNNHFRL